LGLWSSLSERDGKHYQAAIILERKAGGGSGGATRSLPRDRDVEELHGDLTVRYVARSGPKVKNGRSNSKDGAPERLG